MVYAGAGLPAPAFFVSAAAVSIPVASSGSRNVRTSPAVVVARIPYPVRTPAPPPRTFPRLSSPNSPGLHFPPLAAHREDGRFDTPFACDGLADPAG